MRRSDINRAIRDGAAFFSKMNFSLPPFAFWAPEEWCGKGHEYDEIRKNMLGWDMTDFGSDDFHKTGLLLFTLRNGRPDSDKYPKPYAEKIMMVGEGQVTPFHFHAAKTEDIINRGGGTLLLRLYRSNGYFSFSPERPCVRIDGREHEIPAGSVISLDKGESITIEPGLYHSFWGEKGGGPVLAGEVSSSNDDKNDNIFFSKTAGRFPEIEEDQEPLYLLCFEYPEPVQGESDE